MRGSVRPENRLITPLALHCDQPVFRPHRPSHLCSNYAEHWTISDIGPKLPSCPSRSARWAHARRHQRESCSFTAPISTCWVRVSLGSTERSPFRALTRSSVALRNARVPPWKLLKVTTRELC